MDLIIGSHVSFNKSTQMLGSVDEALIQGLHKIRIGVRLMEN